MGYRSLLDGPETIARLVGRPILEADEAPNDSDKTLTVPAGKSWEVLNVRAELTSDPTGGNRVVRLEIQADGPSPNLVYDHQHQSNVLQPANVTRYYQWAPEAEDQAAFMGDDWVSFKIPRLVLPAGFGVRVYDSEAIAPANDNLVVKMLVMELAVA